MSAQAVDGSRPKTIRPELLPRHAARSSLQEALDGLKYGARSAVSPHVLQGAVVELGWLATRLTLYPLSFIGGSGHRVDRLTLTGLTPAQRSLLVTDVRAPGTPRSCSRTGSWTTTRSSP
jgi:triacylglycerol lipase